MDPTNQLDRLLECIHELSCVDTHLVLSHGSVLERLEDVKKQVRSEIMSIVYGSSAERPDDA